MSSTAPLASNERSWWLTPLGLLLVLALASSAFAWWDSALPVLTGAKLERHLGHFAWTYLHVAGGSLMLFLGAANLYLGATRRAARLHRWIGRGYLAGGGLGVAAAVVLSLGPAHKTDAGVVLTNVGVSLLTLSAAWLASAVLAYRAARHRRFDSHRDWMIRNYVLIWAFVFCRIGNRVPGVEEMGDGDAFIWLSWVGPLLACEVALQWRAGGARAPQAGAPPARGAVER